MMQNAVRQAVRNALVVGSLLMAGTPTMSVAQSGPPSGPPRGGERGRDRGANRQNSPRMSDQQREALERRFHERIDAIVKQRLRLTDEQHVKLREVASRTEDTRRTLRREELTARTSLRREMMAGDRADESKVAELLELMPKLERRKLELMEAEQRDLAKFLSPLQRARYFGLQDELRRGMQELQRRRMGERDSVTSPADAHTMHRRPPVPPPER